MFTVMCTATCDISRVGPVVGGWQTPLTVVYSGIPCLEPYPVVPKILVYSPVEPAKVLVQTIFQGDYTVLRNDVCTISGIDYQIREVESWYMRPIDTTFVALTMEEVG